VDFPLLQRLALPINVGSVRVPGIKIQDTGADTFDELDGSVEGSHILDATRAFSLFIDGSVVDSRAAVPSRTTSGTPRLLAETAQTFPRVDSSIETYDLSIALYIRTSKHAAL
jgi:hypothetical protein